MKKLLSILLILALMSSLFAMAALADDAEGADEFIVCVTISVNGETVAPAVPVLVSDLDGDGVYTVDETLRCAHDQLYPGGAEAGYAAVDFGSGLFITNLWGDDSGNYGFYVDNAMAMSASDPVQAGGSVNIYEYTDTEFWSDQYTYFDQTDAVSEDGTLTLTLFAASFDENWSPVFAPFAGAVITIDGEATEFVTDENGQVTICFEAAGSYLISAVSDTAVLVPPICKVTAAAAAGEEPAPEAHFPEMPAPAYTTTYTVKEGDTLRSISRAFYGTIFKWRLIYEANYDSMTGTDMIYVGQVLNIP